MKEKIYRFLNRTTTMDNAITASMVTFLATILLVTAWLSVLAGGFGNMVQAVKFGQVLRVVDSIYIGEADTEAVADLAFDAVIDSLGDRWSSYMTREEFQKYQDQQSNSYTGIGITIRQTEQGWQIVGVSEDSPAHKAGIQPDLYLVQVNEVVLTDETAGEISAMMVENPDHVVVVLSDESGEQTRYELAMEKLYSNPVTYEMLDGSIGYIRIANFDETCGDQTISAIEALMEQGAEGLLFDVRNNGGGFVKELTAILDYLLPEGDIFVSVDYEGNETITKSDKDFVDLPMVVLVNEYSYSAAEFFPAALREYEAAVIVGTQTTGKNRSQTNAVLIDGSAVHISSKQYLTPNRIDLTEQGGLVPDVIAEAGEGDAQLLAALAVFADFSAKFD